MNITSIKNSNQDTPEVEPDKETFTPPAIEPDENPHEQPEVEPYIDPGFCPIRTPTKDLARCFF